MTEPSSSVKQLVIANTKFAINLYRELVDNASSDDGNLVVSPFAVSVALAAVYFGSRENTAKQLKQAMKLDMFDLDDETIHASYAELIASVAAAADGFSLLNGVFAQEGFPFEPEFLEAMNDTYITEARSVNFGESADATRTEINGWAEESTACQVTDVLQPSLDSDSLLVLVNVACFKGHWQKRLDLKARLEFITASAPSSSSNSIKTTFVGTIGEFNYAHLDDLQAEVLELPYASDQQSLIIVLPVVLNDGDEGYGDGEGGSLSHTEELITVDALEQAVSNLSRRPLKVMLPKFRIDQGVSLERGALRALAVDDLFELGQADLSGIDGTEALYVSTFAHRTLLEVSDEGETAGVGPGSAAPAAGEFVANRPFLYFVRDNRTESILMMGRYCSPAVKPYDDGFGARMGISVKNVFKRMSSSSSTSSAVAAPSTPTSSKKPSPVQPVKRQAPVPVPTATAAPTSSPPVTQNKNNTSTYQKTPEQIHVYKEPTTASANQKKPKSKGHSSLFMCCVKSQTDDLDFDSV